MMFSNTLRIGGFNVIELKVEDYHLATRLLQQVPFNTLFAQSVIQGRNPGRVFVDRREQPGACYIASAYGMSLLCGESKDPFFQDTLIGYLRNERQQRSQQEWLQVHPDSWNDLLSSLAETGKIEENTRVNFTFSPSNHQSLMEQLRSEAQQPEIVAVNEDMFNHFEGSVIPRHFWKEAEQFLTAGAGFCVIENSRPASMAFSAYRIEGTLEIGIETAEQSRGKGYAIQACCALIQYCMEQGLEPVWSCRRENEGSYRLAQKLGFIPSVRIPYYLLKL